MEEKKKFENPELNVVQLKQTGMICTSGCPSECNPHLCWEDCGAYDETGD